jgi:TetR/AcrR family transcriptional regulator, transcriptional repressor for nem operon
MARYPSKHKGQTRERILSAADRVIKSRGIEGASVEAVMRDADLTVGGFYAHFASKDDLALEALLFGLERSMERLLTPLASIGDDREWLAALIHGYLRQVDQPTLTAACPLTLLLPEVARGGEEARRAFGARTGALLTAIESRFPEVHGMSRREVATFVFASCAGAVSLARSIAAPRARETILRSTEKLLLRMLEQDRPGDGAAPVAIRSRADA